MHLFVSPLASLFAVINVLSLPLGTGKFLVFSCPLTSQGSLILVASKIFESHAVSNVLEKFLQMCLIAF